MFFATDFNLVWSTTYRSYLKLKYSLKPFLGTKRGDFCYGLDGSIGTVDDYMTDVPINVDCDPRASCKQTHSVETCEERFPTMKNIIVSIIKDKIYHKSECWLRLTCNNIHKNIHKVGFWLN